MWPTDVFPTKNGGHTYLGFMTVREPTMLRKGLVEPAPPSNFELLTDEFKEGFRKGFADKGYELIEPGARPNKMACSGIATRRGGARGHGLAVRCRSFLPALL